MKFPYISINKKLTVILLLVAVFPICLFGFFIVNNSMGEIRNNYKNSSLMVLKRVNQQLDNYIQQADESMFVLLYNNNNSYSAEIDIYNNIQNQLLYIRFTGNDKESLFYYFPTKNEVYVINNAGNHSYLNASDMEDTDWYRDAVSSPNQCVILPQHIQTGYHSRYEINNSEPIFTICRYFQAGNGEPSVLAVNYKVRALETIYNPDENTLGESLICLTKNGELLYSTNELFSAEERIVIYNEICKSGNQDGILSIKSPIDSELYTIVFKQSEQTGIITFKKILNSELNRYITKSIQMILAILFSLIIVIIPLGLVLSRSITVPLSVLEKNMNAFGLGDFTTRAPVKTRDEIGKMSVVFNDMAEQTQKLINEQYALELSCKTAQLYSLIAQINPHFLNNILQSIGGVALERDVPEIYEAVSMLGKILWYSIKGSESVTLAQEIENVQNYLYIQKFRYEGNLTYSLDIDSSLNNIILPKLILQPLVENAVIHGLESKKSGGHIDVCCFIEDDNIMNIEISDNGMGMNQGTLDMITKKFRDNDQAIHIETSHIGLINVYQRLRIIYGNRFSIDIQSEPDIGTSLMLKIILEDEALPYSPEQYSDKGVD